jgi:uncharacterized membrane protein YdfJ with MMPL/SSD domain
VLGRLTRLVLRHPLLVVGAWLLLAAGSAVAARDLGDLLSNRFSIPGSETDRVERILTGRFGERSDGALTVVAVGEPGSAPALVPELRRAADRAAAAVPTAEVTSVAPVADDVATAVVATGLEPTDAKAYVDAARAAVGAIPGAEVFVTGVAALARDLDPVLARDLVKGELIAVPAALAILVFVFGTLMFVLPFVLAAVAVPTALGVVWAAAHLTELSTYVQNMVLLIGIAISIDYSLLVVYRFRDERRAGVAPYEAAVRTAATAGRAVVFSGTAVAIGLALMLALPLPFMRGFGVAGLVIPLVSVAAALTLLPVLLVHGGDRLERVRLLPRAVLDRRHSEGHFWERVANAIMRRPVLFAAGSAGLLLALAAPVVELRLTPGSNAGMPQHLESIQGLRALERSLGAGALAPTEVVVDTGRAGGARDPAVGAAVERLAAGMRADPEIATVLAGDEPPYVAADGRYVRLQAIGRHEYGEPESRDLVHRLRGEIVPAAGLPDGTRALVGGGAPGGVDFLSTLYRAFPWLVAAVLVLTYVLLLRAFRSLLLPLKAIVLNLLSIGAAYGVLVMLFEWGLGEPLGLIPLGEVEGWLPVFLFAMLFGLSMDYEVFLVSRMREEWDAGATNEAAVAAGLAKTGRLVTAAGLIMVAAFSGLAAGSIVGLQQFGVGLAAAILIDVTIVRALLLPSAMKLFGRWNWWLPAGVARLVRVEPSPLGAAPAPGR